MQIKNDDVYTQERQTQIARMSADIDHDYALAASHACLIGNSVYATRNDRIVGYVVAACIAVSLAILIATAKQPIEPRTVAVATARG